MKKLILILAMTSASAASAASKIPGFLVNESVDSLAKGHWFNDGFAQAEKRAGQTTISHDIVNGTKGRVYMREGNKPNTLAVVQHEAGPDGDKFVVFDTPEMNMKIDNSYLVRSPDGSYGFGVEGQMLSGSEKIDVSLSASYRAQQIGSETIRVQTTTSINYPDNRYIASYSEASGGLLIFNPDGISSRPLRAKPIRLSEVGGRPISWSVQRDGSVDIVSLREDGFYSESHWVLNRHGEYESGGFKGLGRHLEQYRAYVQATPSREQVIGQLRGMKVEGISGLGQ